MSITHNEDEYSFCSPLPPEETELEVQLYRDVVIELPEDVVLFNDFINACPLLLKALSYCIHTHSLHTIHGLQFPSEAQPWLLEWIVCDDASIQQLNQVHRAKDAPTDVLSFPLYESALHPHGGMDDIPDVTKQYGGSLGSVVVSWEYAKAHSSPDQRLAYVLERFIHGTLHVLGQHHEDEASFRRVLELQTFILRQLNLESTLLPYDDANH
jgi:probable rRNA maturation factor